MPPEQVQGLESVLRQELEARLVLVAEFQQPELALVPPQVSVEESELGQLLLEQEPQQERNRRLLRLVILPQRQPCHRL
jgi:hypothetical protein